MGHGFWGDEVVSIAGLKPNRHAEFTPQRIEKRGPISSLLRQSRKTGVFQDEISSSSRGETGKAVRESVCGIKQERTRKGLQHNRENYTESGAKIPGEEWS